MELNKTEKKNKHPLGWLTLVVALAALVYGAYEAYTYGRTAVMPLVGGVLVTWLTMFGTMRLFAEKKTPLLVQVLVLVFEMAALVALAVIYLGLLELLENIQAMDDIAFLAPGTSVWSVLWLFAYRVLIGYNCELTGPQWLAHFPMTAAIAVWIIGALALITLLMIEKKQGKREREVLSPLKEEGYADDWRIFTTRVRPEEEEDEAFLPTRDYEDTDAASDPTRTYTEEDEEAPRAPIDLTKIYADEDEDPDATLDPTETEDPEE